MLVEPIQGEAGVLVPPPGFLAGIRELCTAYGALMIADEIQSGLGRTGTTFACEHEDVVPDAYLLGKALGGGIVPVSAVVSTAEVLGVFRPGQHGSTFGGNPLACAVGREVIAMLATGEYQERSAKLGAHMHDRLSALPRNEVSQVRGRGLWAGVEFTKLSGREVCERMARLGVLAKDTHGTHDPAGPAADDHRGGPGLGPGPARRSDRLDDQPGAPGPRSCGPGPRPRSRPAPSSRSARRWRR